MLQHFQNAFKKNSLANKENIPICRLFISVCGVISVRKICKLLIYNILGDWCDGLHVRL